MAQSTRGEGWNSRNDQNLNPSSNGIAGHAQQQQSAGPAQPRYEGDRGASQQRSYYRSAVDRSRRYNADEDRIFRSDDARLRGARGQGRSGGGYEGDRGYDSSRYGERGGFESFDRSPTYARRVERDLPFGGETYGYGQRTSRWQREPATARDVMTNSPKTLTAEGTLRDAARIMRDENCGIVPVTEGSERLIGVITDRDIVVRGVAEDRPLSQLRVSDFMTDEVDCVTPDEPLTSVIQLMGERQVRRIPVVDRQDRLVGIIAMADIAKRADYDEDLQDALERISSRRSFWNRLFG